MRAEFEDGQGPSRKYWVFCKDVDMITEESGLERGHVDDEDINFFLYVWHRVSGTLKGQCRETC